MSEALERLFQAWGTADAEARAAIAEATLGATIHYSDPRPVDPVTTRAGFLAMLDEFQRSMPGASAEIEGPVMAHHSHALAPVAFRRGGETFMHGLYYADLDDSGRVVRLIGFAGGRA